MRGERSKAAFCKHIGVSPPLYQKWAQGSIPGGDKLKLISDACNVSVEWLLGLTDEKQSTSITATSSAVAINGSTATNHPSTVNEAPCPHCAAKDAEINRLNKIIDRLLEK